MKITLAALAAALTLPAAAAVVIEGKDGEELQRLVLDGNRMRMEGKTGEDRGVMIWDGDAKRLVTIDPRKKTYTEFTRDDAKRMRAMVDEQLSMLPPEQRARIAGGAKRPAGKWVKAGRSDRAAGAACEVYRLVREGEDDEELCVAPFGTFGVQKQDFAPLRAFEELVGELTPQGGGGLQWADLPGIPVVAWENEDGKKKETFRAQKVAKAPAAASDFAVPAGFAKDPGFAEQLEAMKKGAKE